MKSPFESGRAFEDQFAKRMGLDKVPNSGATWHSKLDVKGFGARWSLKWTGKKTYTISRTILDEAQEVTDAVAGGTGEIPLWAFEVDGDWYVLTRADDFQRITQEGLVLTRETKASARRRSSEVPQLLRDDV